MAEIEDLGGPVTAEQTGAAIARRGLDMVRQRIAAAGDAREYANDWIGANTSPQTAAAVRGAASMASRLSTPLAVVRVAPTSNDIYGAIDAAGARFPKLQALIDALQGR